MVVVGLQRVRPGVQVEAEEVGNVQPWPVRRSRRASPSAEAAPRKDERQSQGRRRQVGRRRPPQPQNVTGGSLDLPLLHQSADLRLGAVDRHRAGRRRGGPHAAHRPVPQHHAADGAGVVLVSRGQRPGGGRHRGRADRAAGQRRREHALHVVAMHQRRRLRAHRDLRSRHRSEDRPGAGAEPRAVGHAADAVPGAVAGHQHQEEDAQHPHGDEPVLARRPLRHAVHVELRHAPHPRRTDAAARRERRDVSRANATTPSAPGSIRRSWRREASPPARSCRPSRNRTTRWWPDNSASRPPRPARTSSPRLCALGRLVEPEQFGQIVVKTGLPAPGRADVPVVRLRDVARDRTGRSAVRPGLPAQRQALGRPGGLPDPDREHARYGRRRPPEDEGVEAELSRGPRLRFRLRHDARSSANRSGRCSRRSATR